MSTGRNRGQWGVTESIWNDGTELYWMLDDYYPRRGRIGFLVNGVDGAYVRC